MGSGSKKTAVKWAMRFVENVKKYSKIDRHKDDDSSRSNEKEENKSANIYNKKDKKDEEQEKYVKLILQYNKEAKIFKINPKEEYLHN